VRRTRDVACSQTVPYRQGEFTEGLPGTWADDGGAEDASLVVDDEFGEAVYVGLDDRPVKMLVIQGHDVQL